VVVADMPAAVVVDIPVAVVDIPAAVVIPAVVEIILVADMPATAALPDIRMYRCCALYPRSRFTVIATTYGAL
jgi:hypothetical protein